MNQPLVGFKGVTVKAVVAHPGGVPQSPSFPLPPAGLCEQISSIIRAGFGASQGGKGDGSTIEDPGGVHTSVAPPAVPPGPPPQHEAAVELAEPSPDVVSVLPVVSRRYNYDSSTQPRS
jgi:hypothetical protein